MKKNEISKFQIKANYIFKHFAINNIPFPKIIESEELRNKISKEKITFQIHLIDFFMVQNLMDQGEIKKKIIKIGLGNQTPKLSNKIYFNLFCKFNNEEIYSRNNENIFLDNNEKDLLNNKPKIFEIERRILQSMKIKENCTVTVQPSFMLEKNKDFLEFYKINFVKPNNYDSVVEKISSQNPKNKQEIINQEREKYKTFNQNKENDLIFNVELIKTENYEYIFKPNKDNVSKKLILNKGFGKDSPDRDSLVELDLIIKIDNKIIFNSFKKEKNDINFNFEDPNKISDILNMNTLGTEIKNYRNELNTKYNIDLDMDLEFERDLNVYNEIQEKYKNSLNIDMRIYSIPIILRKVLIHMKRGELSYIMTSYIDCFNHGEVDISNSSGKIEIYILLYDFLHRKLFSKMSLEEKYDDLIILKDLANNFFKNGKFFRASKIYQNINYRFNFGDVFGMIFEENELPIKQKNPEMYNKLNDIRISCHNNLASAKLKLGKFYSAFATADKVDKNIDILGNSNF